MGLLVSSVATISSCCNYSEFQKRLNNISSLEDEVQIISDFNVKIRNKILLRPRVSVGFYIGEESCSSIVFSKHQNTTQESKLTKTIIITITHEVFGITLCQSVINYTPKHKYACFRLLLE